MKKARIYTGVSAAIIAAALCAEVCVEWHKQGCGVYSLVAGCVFYTAVVAAIWFAIDADIKEGD